MIPTLLRSTPERVAFRLYSAADHATPVPGVTPTVLVSKAAGAFAPPAGSVSERGGGWFEMAYATADLNADGPLILHAEAPGCDPADVLAWVVAVSGRDPLTAGEASPLPFLLIDLADGVTGAVGLVPDATAYWPDGTTTTGTAAEIGLGWYAPTATPPVAGTAEVAADAAGAATAGATFEVRPAPASGLPTSLLAAIRRRFYDTPELVAAIPGGLLPGVPPGVTAIPWAVIVPVGEAERESATGPGGASLWDEQFQVSVTCPSDQAKADPASGNEDACWAAKRLFYAAFNYKGDASDLRWEDGWCLSVTPANAHLSPEPEFVKGNAKVRQVIFTLKALTARVF